MIIFGRVARVPSPVYLILRDRKRTVFEFPLDSYDKSKFLPRSFVVGRGRRGRVGEGALGFFSSTLRFGVEWRRGVQCAEAIK
jgi:hypothetical protein